MTYEYQYILLKKKEHIIYLNEFEIIKNKCFIYFLRYKSKNVHRVTGDFFKSN